MKKQTKQEQNPEIKLKITGKIKCPTCKKWAIFNLTHIKYAFLDKNPYISCLDCGNMISGKKLEKLLNRWKRINDLIKSSE